MTYLKDEEIIRKAYDYYQNERKNCDEVNSFIGACMELLSLERENIEERKKKTYEA